MKDREEWFVEKRADAWRVRAKRHRLFAMNAVQVSSGHRGLSFGFSLGF